MEAKIMFHHCVSLMKNNLKKEAEYQLRRKMNLHDE